eukprot:gene49804-2452_t
MARDVAYGYSASSDVSFAFQLLDEEDKAPRALLTFALRFLLDDSNASALWLEGASHKEADQLMAKA